METLKTVPRLSAVLKNLKLLIGSDCIFRERQRIEVVRLAGIHLAEDGFEFDLVPI